MAVCPKCSHEMVAQDGKMICKCGYQYSLLKRIPTYKELLQFIKDNEYEKQLAYWMEVKNEYL